MRKTLSVIVVIIALLANLPSIALAAVCADFASQPEAQAAFEAGATELDRNNNGVACETYFETGEGDDPAPEPTATEEIAPTEEVAPTENADPASTPSETATEVATEAVPTATAPTTTTAPQASPAVAGCNEFDAWIWAQSAFDRDPVKHAALDPDGDKLVCQNLPMKGFAPALWTTRLPAKNTPVTFVRVLDGDTIEVERDGETLMVDLQGVVAPTGQACGTKESVDFLTFVMGFAKDKKLVLSTDSKSVTSGSTQSAYVWFEADDELYMVNEAMVRTGYASVTTKGTGDLETELQNAEKFSVKYKTGDRQTCPSFPK